ncbi:cation diffusion facilitator family transporter [Anaeromyxobacter diazotrophicus]|uniref:Cobalt transporter n=1 Tax=Anaeromyxobacter diazotrophicus TaxID=2590199 RepID=A0A7I9VPX0_9BACT|nr:cation diffusion facilitator family transporter [Anaeromyxobacter diazotrophicus]GEJ58435.1 cobalt transporter [Anaeromyxobacter diazotrophicus]
MAEASHHHAAHGHDHAHVAHAHAHHHAAHGPSEAGSARRLAVSLGVASVIMAAEALGGWLSGSLALISDAGHMLTDVAALALALLAVQFGARPADQKRTFGFRRLEVLAAQINVATLLGLTAWIGWEALDRLRHPHPPIGFALMAGTATVGVLGNSVILVWLRGDHNLNTRSAFLHVLGDAVASLAVLVGAGAMWLRPDLAWIDPVLSLAIALLILWGAVRLVVEISDILMEAVPRHLDVEEITEVMSTAEEGVVAVHDLHVWTISSGLYALSAHLVIHVDAVGRNDAILTSVKAVLRRRFGIDHTTLQIESVDYAHVDDVHQH